MSTLSIRRISHSEILGAPNAQRLIAEYAAECSIPEAEPQHEKYAAAERAGGLQCFGAYVYEQLVGFASVLSAVMLHHGKRNGVLESIFVLSCYRNTGAGNRLLLAAEQYADEIDCVALVYTARIGSQLDKLLAHRDHCVLSHHQYTRWLL